MQIIKRVSRWFAIFFLVLVLLFVIAWAALQVPQVQTKVVQTITTKLSKTLQAKVSIDEVDINFFKTVALKGIYIEDQQQDTLLYASQLDASIGLFSLFDSKIILNQINLDGARVKLNRAGNHQDFNFTFLLDAFTTTDSIPKEKAASGQWVFGIDKVDLEKVKLSLNDDYSGLDLTTNITNLSVALNEMDIAKQLLNFSKLQISNSYVRVETNTPSVLYQQNNSNKIATTTPLAFPYSGWDLTFEEIDLDNTSIYLKKTLASDSLTFDNTQRINLNDLVVQQINIGINDFKWTNEELSANIEQLNFREKSGFQLDHLKANINLTPNEINIRNFQIRTPKSQLTNTTNARFQQFNDLVNNIDNITFSSDFTDTKIAYSDIRRWVAALDDIPYVDISTDRYLKLRGKVSGGVQKIQTNNLSLEVGDALRLKMTGSLENLKTPENHYLNVNLTELTTSYDKAGRILKNVALPKALADFGVFKLNGAIRGTLDELIVDPLILQTEANTGFHVAGNITGLPAMEKLKLNLDIQDLYTEANDIRGFVKNGLPPILDTLGKIKYQGIFDGTLHTFNLDGTLSTDLGAMESDLFMNFNDAYTTADYRGDIRLNAFQVGRLLDDSLRIGEVTLSAEVKGDGFAVDSMNADLKMKIENLVFRDYDYNDIVVDGLLRSGVFNGALDLNDPYAKLDFDGKVSFNEERPIYDFRLMIDTINFQKLNLMADPLALHVKMDMNFTGRNINDFDGQINLTNLHLTNEVDSFSTDSFRIVTKELESNKRMMTIASPFLIGKVEGDYNLPELPDLAFAYLNEYFPLNQLTPPSEDSTSFRDVRQPQNFSINLDLINSRPVSFFVPQLEYLEKASLVARFDSPNKTIDLNLNADAIELKGLSIKQFDFSSKGNDIRLNNKMVVSELVHSSGVDISTISLQNRMGNDSMYFDLDLKNDTISQLLQIAATMEPVLEGYRLAFQPKMIANNKAWTIKKENHILFNRNSLFIEDLIFNYKEQSFALQSVVATRNEGVPPIKISFADFQIRELSNIANIENVTFEGQLNGDLTLRNPLGDFHFTAGLDIPDLVLNEASAGALNINIDQKAATNNIDVSVLLKNDMNDFKLVGDYDIASNELDLETIIRSLELRLLDPFLVGVIANSEGTVNGNISLKGTTRKLAVNGKLGLNQISTVVDFTQARYAVKEGELVFNNQEINFGTLQLIDERGDIATLSGQIKHDFFTNLRFDLGLATDRFTALKTTAENNELFFGKLFVRANVRVTGPVELPLVEVTAKTLEGSEFNLSVFSGSEAFEEEDFIIFANPATYAAILENEETLTYNIKNKIPAEIRLTLEVTDDATFRMIVDPVSGDNLECKGQSDLQVNFLPSGAVEMYGAYIISSGQYRFSYSDVVRRNFEISKSSAVFFNGDPLNARLNIIAKYKTEATPFELINNEATLSSSEASFAKNRQDVNVVLDMVGDLEAPELSFDIQLPEAEGSVLSSEIQRKLVELRTDPSELNKQVFGLLLLNSFIASDAASEFATAGESVVLGSVSNFFAGQLNKLADKYVKGIEINVDLNSYRNDYLNAGSGGTVTELGVGVTKRFNDRLNVKASGNFDLSSSGEATGFSQFAGNFVLEYRLTESGNYLLKVFRKSDYDVLNEENSVKSGVGVSFNKSFGRKKK